MDKSISRLLLIGFILLFSFFSFNVLGAGITTPAISKLDVFDADIRDVFRSLGELGNLSVLLDPEVKATVTISLKEGLTVQEAVELLAQTYGYSYRWLPNNRTVIIGNEKTFVNFDVKETRIYHVNYAQPEQVVDALKVIVPKDSIGVDPRTNQLTIIANVLQHENIAEIISRLDHEMPQITIEARVEEIKRSALENIGVQWTKDDIKINFSQPNLAVNATHTLQIWEENSLARVLSNPKIATTDSQEGTIFIGDKYPVITKDETEKGITYKIEYIEIGTKLVVTPRINNDDIVTVNVKATVSNLTEWKKAGENDIPVMRNRETSSVIRLRDGETFVLSGLNELKSLEKESKIKGFGNIPVIGWLFKNKVKDPQEDTEVCIFITPRIIHTKAGVTSTSQTVGNKNIQNNVESETSVQKQATVDLNEQKATPNNSSQSTDTKQPIAQDTTTITQEKSVEPPTVTETGNDEAENNNSNEINEKETDTQLESSELTQATEDSEVSDDDETQPTTEISDDDETQTTTEISDEGQTETDQSTEPSVTEVDETQSVDADSAEKTSTIENKILTVKVKSGDTLNIIATKYGIPVESILNENHLSKNDKLKIGRSLSIVIPQDHIYKLKPKETLWRISKRYGVNIKLIQEINHIADITKVQAGQEIILPVSIKQVANSSF